VQEFGTTILNTKLIQKTALSCFYFNKLFLF
jgi:hypothetical protein